VPRSPPPGHAQVDFGEAIAIIGGVRQKIHFFCMDMPQSDACFGKAYPRETTEAFLDGHVSAFAFFDGVPLSILYDNLTIAVAKICGDGKRERTRAFTELVSHYLFRDRFGRPAKGYDKGKVEGLVKFSRANFMVPIPQMASFEALNAMLEERGRQGECAGRHGETIGERLAADTAALSQQRLLSADGLWLPGHRGEGLCRGGHPVFRSRDCPPSTILWRRGIRLQSAALSGADRDEAQCARPGSRLTGLGSA
jgi:hypothetical protein